MILNLVILNLVILNLAHAIGSFFLNWLTFRGSPPLTGSREHGKNSISTADYPYGDTPKRVRLPRPTILLCKRKAGKRDFLLVRGYSAVEATYRGLTKGIIIVRVT